MPLLHVTGWKLELVKISLKKGSCTTWPSLQNSIFGEIEALLISDEKTQIHLSTGRRLEAHYLEK